VARAGRRLPEQQGRRSVPRPVHDGLVGPRALVGTPYLADPALRAEYDRDIAPRTEVALARVLDELGAPFSGAPVRVIDLGSGTGAVGRLLRERLGNRLQLVEVDAVGAPGVVRADLTRPLPALEGRFDLVVAAHLLNELYLDRPVNERAERRAARVSAWARDLLAPDGVIVLIEPALRETSRDLLAVRDVLITQGLDVVAPCFWTGPCPARTRERDWCHDAAAGPKGARVDFSYLVLRQPIAPRPADPAVFRIVSDPMPEKGRLRLFGCGAVGRHPLIRLDRHRSTANAALDDARRGDVLRVERAEPAGDGLRITAETVVRR
jgi:hypothetical protein